MKHIRIAAVIALSLFAAACGSSSPTSPTPAPSTPTKIISVAGNLAFGEVNINETADRTFTISNSGNTVLTFTGFTCAGNTSTAGFTATPTSGTVAAGATVTVTIRFSPTVARFYSCVLTVTADHTAGGNQINVSGIGVNNTPLFTRSGTGDTVFTIPSTVTQIHIHAEYRGSSQNFIVRIASRLVVNEIIGTFGGRSTTFDGTYLTSGGVTEITNSSGVSWTFTEVR